MERNMPIQSWYADDSQAAGKLRALRKWWDTLVLNGPPIGYFPKPSKTFLVVKKGLLEQAKLMFAGTGVNIVGGGQRDLGAAIGSETFVRKYLQDKVEKWTKQLECLSAIARTQPHAAHAGFVHGVRGKWSFCQRVMSQVADLMQPLEDVIRNKFIPALIGDDVHISDDERALFALPARHSGLGIDNPVLDSPHKFRASVKFTEALTDLLKSSQAKLSLDIAKQKQLKYAIKMDKEARLVAERAALRQRLPAEMQRAMDFANEKGASCAFTALPLLEQKFVFRSKRDFRDIVRMRYRKRILGLPTWCSCHTKYSLDHSQICKLGGFIHMRHNSETNLFARLAKQAFNDVEVEPPLLALSGEKLKLKSANTQPDARSDVRVRGFWTRQQNAFFDFRVIYPFASSYLSKSPAALFRMSSKHKKRVYLERITSVDNGSFTPMIMSSSGGMGPEMTVAIKHLARKLAEKRNEPYAATIGLLRCRFSFEMMRSALVCLRGSRTLKPRHFDDDELNEHATVVVNAARLF